MPRGKKTTDVVEVVVEEWVEPEVRRDALVPVPTWHTDEERHYAAHQERLKGKDWAEVARLCGYANEDSARIAVRAYLQRAADSLADEHRTEALQAEISRLNTLQAAVWDQALNGDLKAVDTVVRVISTRAKLMGLDREGEKVTNNTVVVTEKDFVAIMQAHAEGRA
jgi:hypothetical protein